MEMNDFINKFSEALELDSVDGLTPETKFRENPNWNSLAALSLIAMADEEYGKEIEASDIKNAVTILDLFNTIVK